MPYMKLVFIFKYFGLSLTLHSRNFTNTQTIWGMQHFPLLQTWLVCAGMILITRLFVSLKSSTAKQPL